ncbi:MAG: hypothetical protein HWE22_12425 [Flavobacteriales bacterium]|nr:hypothetical protein [Flavobacteriales bacterium]
MIRYLFIFIGLFIFTSCWPTRVSFQDLNFPEEWKAFTVKTFDNNAPNTPLSYAPTLTESVKDAIQNNTSLNLVSSSADDPQLEIEGVINNYSISPVALQEGDQAAKNRLSVSATFTIFINAPEEDEMTVNSNRFVDYDANTDLGVVETTLLEEVNAQIVQDIINKLFSNW